jgi:hypothetical protein
VVGVVVGAVVGVGVDVVVVVDVVLVVDVVDDEAAARSDVVSVVARPVPSSRPWKRSAEVDTTMTAATTSAPITHPRVPNRPTTCESAPSGEALSQLGLELATVGSVNAALGRVGVGRRPPGGSVPGRAVSGRRPCGAR